MQGRENFVLKRAGICRTGSEWEKSKALVWPIGISLGEEGCCVLGQIMVR